MEGDEAESYLRRATSLRWKHFPNNCSVVAISPVESHRGGIASGKLPMKKRKRGDDEDNENVATKCHAHEGTTAVVSSSSYADTTSLPPDPKSDGAAPTKHTKITLMDKWFPGSTLRSATLDPAQAPPLCFIDMSVERMKAAREHLLNLRAGVEDVMRFAHLSSRCAAEDIERSIPEWSWLELRDTLLQFASHESFYRKAGVVNAVKNIMLTRPCASIPRVPRSSSWNGYLMRCGPEQGYEPSLSLFIWLDSACTTALFTAAVERLLKLYKNGMKPAVYSFYDAQDNPEEHTTDEVGSNSNVSEDAASEGVNYSDETNDSKQALASQRVGNECQIEEGKFPNTGEGLLFLDKHLPPLSRNGVSDDVISLLSFMRAMMPVDYLDKSGKNVIGHSTGYGIWLYACFAAVDTPLDPDLDRLVHELFRVCCRQLQTLGEQYNIRGDDRGAIARALDARPTYSSTRCQYNTLSDLRRDDVLALHTIVVVLAKLFRQNQNRLVPL
ncbi:putative Survival motor neuron (SMN) interacting protein 1 (SIP1) [Trypanosoma vivax]|uniref:Uncharacterized protein n=1 Tax=Trypanosoma vivax (strain Y486) TaxID=1055687 RepID=G0U6L4_TRYVY|nr:hypothetical protein TRVL_06208 [Trypanosoma vivax]KAH8611121.1 putative Survival motor neuron (SMN) interacting protein 1 (SIP1) [Trypanosoma vivax]CCC51518.1 conserved hypothetical protein [Trypanosoma vivax Y486]